MPNSSNGGYARHVAVQTLHYIAVQPSVIQLHPEGPDSEPSHRTGEHQHAGLVYIINRKVCVKEVATQMVPPLLEPAIDGCQLVAEKDYECRQRSAVLGCWAVVFSKPGRRIGLKELALAAGCCRMHGSGSIGQPCCYLQDGRGISRGIGSGA